jgi:hypothetical protein
VNPLDAGLGTDPKVVFGLILVCWLGGLVLMMAALEVGLKLDENRSHNEK